MGMVDRGADMSWLSQYSHEKEILFPPLIGQQALATRVATSTLIVETRLNVNMQSLTLEEVLSKRRKLLEDTQFSMAAEVKAEEVDRGTRFEEIAVQVFEKAVQKEYLKWRMAKANQGLKLLNLQVEQDNLTLKVKELATEQRDRQTDERDRQIDERDRQLSLRGHGPQVSFPMQGSRVDECDYQVDERERQFGDPQNVLAAAPKQRKPERKLTNEQASQRDKLLKSKPEQLELMVSEQKLDEWFNEDHNFKDAVCGVVDAKIGCMRTAKPEMNEAQWRMMHLKWMVRELSDDLIAKHASGVLMVVPPRELKQAGFHVAPLKAGGFTLGDIKRAGYALFDAKAAGYSSQDAKDAGYALTAMKEAGYSVQEVKQVGFTVEQTREAGYTCVDAGITRAAGYSLQEIEAEGYFEELEQAGYSIEEAKAAGYTLRKLVFVGYTLGKIRLAGFSVAEAKDAEYSLQGIKEAGYSLQEAKDGGFTLEEIKEAGYVDGLREAGYSMEEAKAAGYTLQVLKAAGYSMEMAKELRYTLQEMRAAGYSLRDALDAGYTLHHIKAVGYSLEEFRSQGGSVREAKGAGFDLQTLKAAGYSSMEVETAGFSLRAMRTAGYSLQEMQEAGSLSGLRAAGFTLEQMKALRFTLDEIKTAGYVGYAREARARQAHAPKTVLSTALDRRQLRYSANNKAVEAPPTIVHGGYHIYLSHVWGTGQDQMILLKQRLRETLRGVKAFLDIENLEDISQLESHIEDSDFVLIFLTKGYLDSKVCHRDLTCAFTNRKRIIACMEADERKGGISREEVRQLLAHAVERYRQWEFAGHWDADALYAFIFSEPVIIWERFPLFADVSLRLIAERLLSNQEKAHSSNFASWALGCRFVKPLITRLRVPDRPPPTPSPGRLHYSEYYLDGELSAKDLKLPPPNAVTIYCSPHNLGSTDLIIEVGAALGVKVLVNQSSILRSSSSLSLQSVLRSSSSFRPRIRHRRPLTSPSREERGLQLKRLFKREHSSADHILVTESVDELDRCDFVLVYLNDRTWTSDQTSENFAEELRRVLETHTLLLAHEMIGDDCERRGGCDFAEFFSHNRGSTPEDLIRKGIYHKIASPLKGGAWRTASLV